MDELLLTKHLPMLGDYIAFLVVVYYREAVNKAPAAAVFEVEALPPSAMFALRCFVEVAVYKAPGYSLAPADRP